MLMTIDSHSWYILPRRFSTTEAFQPITIIELALRQRLAIA
jgi:hypothetical protein